MRGHVLSLFFAGLLALSLPGFAVDLSALSNRDATTGLKDALAQGARAAVEQLSAADGFLGNSTVRIPLPESLAQIEGGLRMMGMGKQADELVTGMNRAAEMAVKQATPLLISALKNMSVQDAKGILSGGDDAATQYFKRSTSAPLTKKFLPIVKDMTAKVQLAAQYNHFAGQASQLGLIDKQDADIDQYVTRKALDGLFTVIGEKERAIRQNPMGAATDMAQKVFGALGR